MSRFCPHCGAEVAPGTRFCGRCGGAQPEPAVQTYAEPTQVQTYAEPMPVQTYAEPMPVQTAGPVQSVAPGKVAKKQNRNPAGKKKKKGGLVFLLVLVCIVAVISFAWFAVGNYFTLKIHTNEVLESLNGGNLDLSAFQTDPYEDLPLYVIDMMGETSDPSELGPIVTAMAPYLTFDRVEIRGFFGGNEVEYRIVSRDLESWLLSLDYSAISSPEQLQQMMLEYLPQAPLKEFYVTVEYTRDGLFGWTGDYETPEFADAITGGLNTAYNTLYDRMMQEMEDLLG